MCSAPRSPCSARRDNSMGGPDTATGFPLAPQRRGRCTAADRGSTVDVPRSPAARGGGSQRGVAGVNVLSSAVLFSQRGRIIRLAANQTLPTIYQWPETAEEGGLIAHGPSRLGQWTSSPTRFRAPHR